MHFSGRLRLRGDKQRRDPILFANMVFFLIAYKVLPLGMNVLMSEISLLFKQKLVKGSLIFYWNAVII